jgi:ribosomal protein S18 acetylase RimI-like enzyme
MPALNNDYQIKLTSPSIDDFIHLRTQVGWSNADSSFVGISLRNSLFHVTVYAQKELIGMGRVIGDGALYFYVQDVVVKPVYQGKGIGKALMSEIEKYLAVTTTKGATIGLLSAKGKEDFYRRYGYLKRPNDDLGAGMCKFK